MFDPEILVVQMIVASGFFFSKQVLVYSVEEIYFKIPQLGVIGW